MLLFLAPKINDKSITTSNLDKVIKEYINPKIVKPKTKYKKDDDSGKELYAVEPKENGKIFITLNRELSNKINPEVLNERLLSFLNELS